MGAKAECSLEPIAIESTQEGWLGLSVPLRWQSARGGSTSNEANTLALR